ncbi:auxilin-related protein 1 [Euphorbia lathyris]|uniref:auxilin-related protein 1 n=1 Tax=Euphorbia lathyris TaxID=212925 RepID=UPI0033136F80
MDDFPGILARDFGFKPQGKSAPMATSRNSNNNINNSSTGFSSVNFGLGSGGSVNSRSPSASTKSAPVFDDHDRGGGSDGLLFNDVFGGPPKYTESRGGVGGGTTSSFDYDSIFKDQNAKAGSLPVYDKPVYDDDIFEGLPGLKTTSTGSQSAKFDNVFATIGSPASPKHRSLNNSSAFDDLLGNIGKKEAQHKREASKAETDSAAFDDLLPGFGSSSSPSISRSTSESSQAHKPSANSGKTASSVMEDPFAVLESTSTPAASSGGLYTDPLEEIGKFSSSGSAKVDTSSTNMGAFDDIDAFDNLGKSVPPVSAGINKRGNDRGPSRTGSSMGDTYSPASKDPVDKYPVDEAAGHTHKAPNDDFQEPHETLFEMPTASTNIHRSAGQNVSSPPYVNASPSNANSPPRSEDISESSNDIWLSVSEVPLYTQPTSAPPPSRPPPPRPPRMSSSTNSRRVNEYSFSNSNSYSQSPRSSHAARGSVPTQIDELEDFAIGRTQNSTNEHGDVLYGEDVDANASSAAASAAAMKDAMDKAEAKFRQMREREYLKAARIREAVQPDRDVLEAQQRELRERHGRSDRERQQREQEEEEREQRRLERERERAREIEREKEEKEREQRRLERERERAREIEREREKARQAVERATREARERAAADARQRAERAAVEKASAGARERAERAAVQRAQAEARERAAADARERAEKAAAEARERANAEARERDARERAAVARAESDARQRAERAAVERAAAEARERAAAAARANQQRNENDLESFFTSRASSAPRPRANPSDPFFDTQNKGGSETAKRTSVGTTSNMKKASSTTNIVDDLSTIFGGTGTTGDFPEVEGETEERRKARLERHQRTQERAAKALAEKNQRDLQVQRDQAERNRIAETLDAEIKRWAAGKEGNLRALLSTMQYVLWPECGWQPVSLTDLITGASVKKVYRKATLCIHPDKVQQKGANLQQKYIAEKVFDLLKEAWNKFNSEELF